ncbi:hypothetical protein Dimus_003671 [Dionaea muscipula]
MSSMNISAVVCFFLVFLGFLSFSELVQAKVARIFNISDYGAIAGGRVDNSQALLDAWADACKWKGMPGFGAQVLIPEGYFLVNDVKFKGPCNSPINFRNRGVILAAQGVSTADHWLNFQYIDQLMIDGRGVFDGQGLSVWHKINPSQLPIALSLDFVSNSKIQHMKMINGKTTHLSLFSCNNVKLRRIIITAPETSPNTDGIKIAESEYIQLSDSSIGSGDDCVALLTGSKNINISGIFCGPGHGISIGSMGSSSNFDQVSQVSVKDCRFTNTSNGVRIKTWATMNPGLVSDVTFQGITMDNVDNPIIIDQNYCPENDCPKGNSHVKISDVKYRNITGSSRSQFAVNLQCSGTDPCRVELIDIDLTYDDGNGDKVLSSCSNVQGSASGVQVPKSCF